MCDTVALHRAYGVYFIEVGAGLIMLGLLSGFLVVPAFAFGLRRHNRFIIICCFFMDTIIMSCLLHLGSSTGNYLVPEFSKELQAECLMHVPTGDENKCRTYLRSDRTSGFRLVWAGIFTLKDTPQQYQILKQIQDANGCCGFFPPLNCKENHQGFPPDRPLDDIAGALTKQRLTCGLLTVDDPNTEVYEPAYYPVQDNCVHISDTGVPAVVGGCRFDLAIGSQCIETIPGDDDTGCVSGTEDYVASLIETHVYIIGSFCPLFNFLGMIFTCCMYWKRKPESDVFPDFLAEAKFEFNYAHVKDQFEVRPKKNLLKKAGFYAPSRDDEESKMEGPPGGDVALMNQ